VRVAAATLGLLALAASGPAGAAGLCERIEVPAQLGLACAPVAGSAAENAVSLGPVAGGFASLSRMTVRRLARASDPLAWGKPEEWLQRQLVLDTSSLADAVDRLVDDPDSPWSGPTAMLLAESVREALENVGQAPLQACSAPTARADGHAMRCTYGVGSFGLLLELRLVATGDERYAVTFRSMNERRQRHFEAIANGFRPG
jgi:hypothetical protein